jgi:hypothetical protein
VTIDRYDLQTRYRLWTDDELRTFLTERAVATAGGRVAEMQGPPEVNPYGMIPFAFVHYVLPINDFWEPGIGDFLTEGEIRVNDRLSRLEQAIHKHLIPIPIVKDAPDGFQLILGQPNLFVRLNRRASPPSGDFGQQPPTPEISYLQADIDIQGAWEDLTNYVNQVLESARVPRSAVRMEQTGVASGISLMVEQEPLLNRARHRQPMFSIYEEQLARLILAVAGIFYRRPPLVRAARDGHLQLAWPLPSLTVQTDDWLNLQLVKEQAGLTSKIMITMETYCVDRDRAIEILEQVAEDKEDEARILPLPTAGQVEEPEDDEDKGEDKDDDKDDEDEDLDEPEEEEGPTPAGEEPRSYQNIEEGIP